jgi:malate/lactate dehydrogenase
MGESYKVAIVGVGRHYNSFGWVISQSLLGLKGLEKLILYDRNRDEDNQSSARNLEDHLIKFMYDWKRVLDSERYKKPEELIQCSDYREVRKADIVIVAVDKSSYMAKFEEYNKQKKEYEEAKKQYSEGKIKEEPKEPLPPNRQEMLNANIPPIMDVAERLKGYKGTVIVASNPTDILAYAFHAFRAESERNLSNIIFGFNHIDTYRFRDFVAKRINQVSKSSTFDLRDIEGFMSGPHLEHMFPLYSTVKISKGLPLSCTSLNTKPDKEAIKDITKSYGTELLEKLYSSIDVGHAMNQVIEAIIYGEHAVELSRFFKLSDHRDLFIPQISPNFNLRSLAKNDGEKELFPDLSLVNFLNQDEGIYMGVPVRFKDRVACFFPLHLDDTDQENFLRTYVIMHQNFKDFTG